ncbi:MAG: tetratricopeptide repeat protein [Flavobacteriales bacterium]|nr:tetratricopeptide repeat protein [Flavobacteriales bacterium]MBK6883906.1 tetratricopeptide repeat protein [Flavobacteriales bacterium]MBK7100297.1 tetratricopeptide repeat protein [Flavobacteriales bacterium]MBK7110991.1 tetratricopeptide repeat protein [Flavobacteriales bacterium]MBK7481269.1 tetratricopeptide repeat protein [Flavobacteriales bacterium]
MLRTILVVSLVLPMHMLAQPDALVHLKHAESAYQSNALDQALAYADSAIKLDSSVPGGYKLRGDIKQRQRDMHGALMDYVKSEKLEPENPRLYVSRSAIHITEGRVKEAMRDVDRAIDLDKSDADAWYNRACANYIGQANDGALRDLEKCLELRPGNADALFLRGVVKGELYKEKDGIADIHAALALNPKIIGGAMSLGVLLFETKEYEAAIVQFTQVIDAKREEFKEALYYRAECYYELKNKEMACNNWRQCADLGEGDAKFIVRNYCNTDEDKIPKKPVRGRRKMVIEF